MKSDVSLVNLNNISQYHSLYYRGVKLNGPKRK